MTKCGIYWKKVQEFRKNDDFEGFCNWCQTGKDMLLEEWKIAEIIERLEISSLEIGKLPADAFRPLIHKENETILSDVLPKVRSYLKNGHKLTRLKTEEFVARARGVCKGTPPSRRIECENPNCFMGTSSPIVVDGRRFCSQRCADKMKTQPRFTPKKVEKKTYDPMKPSWKEAMHPKVSKMEEWLREKLSEKGISFLTDQEFCAIKTYPDVYFPEANLALYLDGEKVHRDRVHKDDFLRKRFTENTGIKIVGLTYRDNTQKSKDEILQKVLDEVVVGEHEK